MSSAQVAFMITAAQKRALRARGLDDEAIRHLTPADAHALLMTPDEHAVRNFLSVFVALATASLDGHPPPGVLQMCRKHPSDKVLIPTRYRLDSADLIDSMTRAALADSEAGHNIYLEARLVDFGLRGKKRGELAATRAVFALVVDSDADKNMAWNPPAGVRPTLVVETSPNNRQFWIFFKRALSSKRAQQLGENLRRVTAGDSDTGNPVQPYRIPGTTNYPDKVKISRGRVTTPTLFLGAAL
jgi:RepB DNA-primase from phage plasmid